MKRKTAIITAILAILLVMANDHRLFADHVFLKDGSIIECAIINENTAAVTARLKDGRIATYSRNNVLRVVYTQLYMGKVYVNLVDGRVLECYIVDEDRENYTMRMDINKPVEFTVKRTDVLFMVRKNPSALEGKISQRHVDLSWKAPYNPVKKYKIYVKTKKGTYQEAGESRITRYRLKGLSCNMKYTAMVTAIDRDNYESLPSNEFQIETEKGKPLPPGNLTVEKITSDMKQVFTARVKWDKAEDPCGGVINNYRVYMKAVDQIPAHESGKQAVLNRQVSGSVPTGYTALGTTTDNSFNVRNLKNDTSYSVLVTSVDDKKEESPPGNDLTFDTGKKRPSYPFPVFCEKELTVDKRILTARIIWKEVPDTHRRIAGYRIYTKTTDGFELTGITDKSEYIIKGLTPDLTHVYMVRAVDIRGVESENSYLVSTGLIRYVELSARAACLFPIRDYGRLYRTGWGASLSVSVKNLFFNGISLGVITGYNYLYGKTEKSRYTSMVPFMAFISWQWHPLRWFSLDPEISFGGTYNSSERSIFTQGSLESALFQRYVKECQAELMFSVGTNATFILKKNIILQIGVDYSGIIEKPRLLDFVSIRGGVGFIL